MRVSLDNVVPNLLRHFFPSYRVPQLNFSESSLPARMPGSAFCIDSTLALGLPALRKLNSQQIVNYIEIMNQLNRKSGLLRQVEIAVDGPVEREALEVVLPRFRSGELQVEPVATIPGHPDCVDPLVGLDLRVVGISIGCSDHVLIGEKPASRREPILHLFKTIDACLEQGFKIRLDLLDITRADIEAFVIPLVSDVTDHLAAAGGSLAGLRVADSLGLGLPWTEVPVPRSVPRMIHTLTHHLGLPFEKLEFLGHNDLGMALANSIAAMVHGCCGHVTTLGGCGERAGVTPTELMLVHLSGCFGIDLGLHLVEAATTWLREAGGYPLPAAHPLWGEQALTRRFAPHRRATLVTYPLNEPFNASRLLKRPVVLTTRLETGTLGLAFLIRKVLPNATLADTDERLMPIITWLDEQGLETYTWKDIEKKVFELMPQIF